MPSMKSANFIEGILFFEAIVLHRLDRVRYSGRDLRIKLPDDQHSNQNKGIEYGYKI